MVSPGALVPFIVFVLTLDPFLSAIGRHCRPVSYLTSSHLSLELILQMRSYRRFIFGPVLSHRLGLILQALVPRPRHEQNDRLELLRCASCHDASGGSFTPASHTSHTRTHGQSRLQPLARRSARG